MEDNDKKELWIYLNRKVTKVLATKDSDSERYYCLYPYKSGVLGQDFFTTREAAIADGIQKLKKKIAMAKTWKREVERLEVMLADSDVEACPCKHCHGTGVVVEVLEPLVTTDTNKTLP